MISLQRVFAAVGLDIWDERALIEVVLDDFRDVGVDEFVVGDTGSWRVCNGFGTL